MKRWSAIAWIGAVFALLILLGCGRQLEQTAMNEQLITAAGRGDTAAVLRLLAEGADINAQGARGRTAVLAATHSNHVETVRALIQAGADVNIRDERTDNVLLYAGA